MALKKPLASYSGKTKELTTGDTIGIPVAQLTGAALSFTQDGIYGTFATPIAGNITGVITGALLGSVVMVIHNSATAPTFDAKFKKLSGSGEYVLSSINYIYCQYVDSTHIVYSINQSA